jgi:parallel beta-helix repeat protein
MPGARSFVSSACSWVVAMGVAAGSASAHKKLPVEIVVCGQTITQSVQVGNNLADCPGHGLVIGAPNVILDLGGHRIDGTGDPGENGVDASGGFDGVTVRNGTLIGFSNAVRLIDVTGGEISGIQALQSAKQGFHLSGSSGITIRGNTIRKSVDNGMLLESSIANTIRDNFVTASGNSAIQLVIASDRNVLKGNTLTANAIHGFAATGSSFNLLKRNVASGNGVIGFLILSAADNQLRANTASGNEFGFFVDDHSTRNVLTGNAALGNSGDGIQVNLSPANTFVANRAVGNGEDGIDLVDEAGNVFTRNQANENGLRGIVSNTNALTLERNTANRNGFLGGVDDNVGLGIDVPLGTTNSGNKALNNDDPNECGAADLSCRVAP